MSNVYYTFQLDNPFETSLFQAAKQANRSSAELLRELMQDFVQKQAIGKQKISLAEKLSTYPHQAADVDFEFERKK
ncbi:MAG: hypothetical protein Q4B82_02015 [Alysiella sp.]|uniref:hypothetical protein n=1 Tax=Alysiella sp. TaxID=1872483 RepID=UPI0026DBB1BF|nr:hypothetical protein [Alysiella sp.]MDO4433339.1 hypothetical protein [Alysiella sp.]